MDPCLYVVIQHVRGFPSLTSGSYTRRLLYSHQCREGNFTWGDIGYILLKFKTMSNIHT